MFLGLTAIVCFSSCATLVNGPRQTVDVITNPIGAHVRVDGMDYGTTPAKISLERKNDHFVVVSLPGHQEQQFILKHRINGYFWGNIVFGGMPGFIIDSVSGSMFTLAPKTLNVSLIPECPLHGK